MKKKSVCEKKMCKKWKECICLSCLPPPRARAYRESATTGRTVHPPAPPRPESDSLTPLRNLGAYLGIRLMTNRILVYTRSYFPSWCLNRKSETKITPNKIAGFMYHSHTKRNAWDSATPFSDGPTPPSTYEKIILMRLRSGERGLPAHPHSHTHTFTNQDFI